MMKNPIKTWFFELIEDAIGSKAMKQFKKEEEKKNSKSNSQPKADQKLKIPKSIITKIINTIQPQQLLNHQQ